MKWNSYTIETTTAAEDLIVAMLDELVRQYRKKDIRKIVGYYYKTPKNAMVQDLYGTFGFTKVKAFENGDSTWELDVASYRNKNQRTSNPKSNRAVGANYKFI